MAVELDHVFFLTSVDAPEAECLLELGLEEGQPNWHHGQGTACRRFYFAKQYFELLWVADRAESQSEVARPVHLYDRWLGRNVAACPFGVICRQIIPDDKPPFPAWEYRPPYLPPPSCLHIGTNADLIQEPLLVYYATHHRPAPRTSLAQRLASFSVELREVTALRIFLPRTAVDSDALQAAQQTSVMTIQTASDYLAEIGFDGEPDGQRLDLRPTLPLALCW